MSRFRFELATPADDAELRQVLAQTPMAGDVWVSFRRDPSYFDAAVVSGDFSQTVIARDLQDGTIVGCGARSVRTMFVNTQPLPIGYLSSLRVLPKYRNLGLIARGYAFFRRLHLDGRTSLYLTTIAEGNGRAESLLTSGRAGLPPYHFAGKYHTFVLPVRRNRPNGPDRGDGVPAVRSATSNDLPDVLAFLEANGPRRQFFPQYTIDDFFKHAGTFRDLREEDLLLAFRDGRLVGTLGVWDQRAYRQSVVEKYSTRVRWTRLFYNAWAAVSKQPKLPRVGRPFNSVVGAIPVVADDDTRTFGALLEKSRLRAARIGADHILIGLHEADSLCRALRPQAVATYTTRLYNVCWDAGEELRMALDGSVPYLELGTL